MDMTLEIDLCSPYKQMCMYIRARTCTHTYTPMHIHVHEHTHSHTNTKTTARITSVSTSEGFTLTVVSVMNNDLMSVGELSPCLNSHRHRIPWNRENESNALHVDVKAWAWETCADAH